MVALFFLNIKNLLSSVGNLKRLAVTKEEVMKKPTLK